MGERFRSVLLVGFAGLVQFVVLAGCSEKQVVLRSAGAEVRVELEPFRLVVMDGSGRVALETLAAGEGAYGGPALTVDRYEEVPQLLPGWDGYQAHEEVWRHATHAQVMSSHGADATLALSGPNVDFMLKVAVEGSRVSVRLEKVGARAAEAEKSAISFRLPMDEHFFGLGERFASVDHRGLSLYAWAEEGGLGLGETAPRSAGNPAPNGPSMTYFPVPFFLSSRGYGLWAATEARSELHLGSEQPDAWRLAVNASGLALVIYLHDDPKMTLNDFTRDTGRPLLPALWVFGPRRRVSLGQTVGGVEEWRLLRERHVPTTVLDDSVHLLPQRSELGHEAELRRWTTQMHAEGFKVTAYNNPYISESLRTGRADYEEGSARGFFAREPSGQPALTVLISGELQNVASVDFTNAAAVAWYQGLLRRTLDLGYDGWMHDFGEYVGRRWLFSDRRRGDVVHSVYPVLSAKAAHDLLTSTRGDDFLIYVRAGYVGTQQYTPEVWGGDPEASFDETQGLPAALRGGLNLALSGVPYWGSDISGFKCITDAPRDKEVYLRWAEVGAVSPSMHDENACSNPLGHREKWTLFSDDETTAVYAKMARLHTRLALYLRTLAVEAHETGLPLMRHPFLVAPKSPAAWAVEDAFFLGPALYAAPVVRRDQRVREVFLPPGGYVDLDDFTLYRGGQSSDRIRIPAPLDKLPLLLVENQILPLLDAAIETLVPTANPAVRSLADLEDRLDAIVALGPGGKAQIELFDGTRLTAERTAAAGSSSDQLREVAPAELRDCELCFSRTSTGAHPQLERVRISTRLELASEIRLGDLHLSATHERRARRVRWDVLRLPE